MNRLNPLLLQPWLRSLGLTAILAAGIWFIGPLLAIAGNTPWVSVVDRLWAILALVLLWGLLQTLKVALFHWRNHQQQSTEQRQRDKHLHQLFRLAARALASVRLPGARQQKLPWYLLLGRAGSGKSSLIEGWGSQLPTIDPDDTACCRFHFREKAVVIEVAGPLLDQDIHSWQTLLGLLRRQRQQPLDGVLLDLAADDLLNDEPGLERFAQHLRQRLHELRLALRSEVPVYLIVSRVDRLAGFAAFFEHASRDEQDQVLGFSFAAVSTENQDLHGEFAILQRHLESQMLMRLNQQRDPHQRGQLIEFPQQLQHLAQRLGRFVELALSGNPYQPGNLLRGVYLTSAIPGRPRFLRQLFERVIFAEVGLARLDPYENRRQRWRQCTYGCLALATLLCCCSLWYGSYLNNQGRLAQLHLLGPANAAPVAVEDDARFLLPLLDQRLAATDVFNDNDHLGLDQGEAVAQPVQAIYRQTLQRLLLPQISLQLEQRLRDGLGNRQRLPEDLRAYLMLEFEQRRDLDFLYRVVTADWARRYPEDKNSQSRLERHLRNLLEQPWPKQQSDRVLVAQARQVLRQESPANAAYLMLQEQARQLPEYRLARAPGHQAQLLLGNDYRIPGLYTRQGYQRYLANRGLILIRSVLDDDWVLDEGDGLHETNTARLAGELEQLYFRDYTRHWRQAVSQLGLDPIDDPAQGVLQLSALTAAGSPLLQMLNEIRDNTHLDLPDADPTATVSAQGLPDSGREALRRSFEPLHQLLDEQGGPSAELVVSLQALDAVQQQLAAISHSGPASQVAFEQAKARMNGQADAISRLRGAARQLPSPLGDWLTLIADDTWQLTLDEAYGFLNRCYRSDLYGFYRESLKQRYPFNSKSASDVSLADFREFFKEQGLAAVFVERYLQPFLYEVDGDYLLRRVDGQSLPLSPGFLARMSQARSIRRSFFAESPDDPLVRFSIEPFTLDSGLSRAQFNFAGQQLEYRHGPVVAIQFQWPSESAQRVSLTLQEHDGRQVGIERGNGPWSLFRLLDSLRLSHHDNRDALLLNAEIAGRHANYLLHSQRSPNPFERSLLHGFQLPVAL